jgi:hypothetical protein
MQKWHFSKLSFRWFRVWSSIDAFKYLRHTRGTSHKDPHNNWIDSRFVRKIKKEPTFEFQSNLMIFHNPFWWFFLGRWKIGQIVLCVPMISNPPTSGVELIACFNLMTTIILLYKYIYYQDGVKCVYCEPISRNRSCSILLVNFAPLWWDSNLYAYENVLE